MDNKANEIEQFAREKFSKAGMDWFVKLHLEYVERLALQLAEKKKADKDVLKLSAWLHDINHGDVREDHHIANSEFAVSLLEEKGFDRKIVEAVEHCILTHRCKDKYMPKSTEAKIFASADAMSHIENFSMLLFAAFVLKRYDLQQAYDWLSKKIDRDWNHKILIPEGKDMIKNKYAEVQEILKKMAKQVQSCQGK